MAFVDDGYVATVSLVDTSGSVSTLRYELNSLDFVEAQADLDSIIEALEDVSDSRVKDAIVGLRKTQDAFVFPVSAENAVKASVSVYLAGVGLKRANIQIPAPNVDIFTGETGRAYNIVDASNLDLLTYVGLFQASGVATISDGEVVRATDPIDAGKRISRASRNP